MNVPYKKGGYSVGRPKGSLNRKTLNQKGRPGRRPMREGWQIWAVNPFDGDNSSSSVVISMCIKEDIHQTMGELAVRVADCKDRPVGECLAVLRDMEKRGWLGYYECDDFRGFYFKRWTPGEGR